MKNIREVKFDRNGNGWTLQGIKGLIEKNEKAVQRVMQKLMNSKLANGNYADILIANQYMHGETSLEKAKQVALKYAEKLFKDIKDFETEEEKLRKQAEKLMAIPEENLLTNGNISYGDLVGETVFRKEVFDILFKRSKEWNVEPRGICSYEPEYNNKIFTKDEVLCMGIYEYLYAFWKTDIETMQRSLSCYGVMPM